MDKKFTKGKWIVNRETHYYTVNYQENGRGMINLFMVSNDYQKSDSLNEECEANALLISKAPEMLEMLEYLVQNGKINDKDIIGNIKNLIQEATEL